MKRIIITIVLSVAVMSLSAQSYFTPQIEVVNPATALTRNGIINMEWISFAGEPFVTGKQIKNGWGKSSSGGSIEFLGSNLAGLPSEEYTNQNNDWLITPEIDLTGATSPVLEFDFIYNFGVDNTNTLSVWVCTGGYVSGATPTGNDPKAMPSGEWVQLVKAIYGAEPKMSEHLSFSLKDYAGGKVRVALRATNRLKQNINNSRLYNINNLIIKEK